MKYLKVLLSIAASILILQGCGAKQATDSPIADSPTDEPPIGGVEIEKIEKEVKTIMQEIIEDFDSYELTDSSSVYLGTASCEAFAAFNEKVKSGEIKMKYLSNIGNNKLAIYITPNYDSWTDEDVREANGCIDGAGANSALKVFDDYILWGHPGCSSGAAPMKDSEAYVGFEECMEAGNKLTEYLRSS